MKPKKKISSAPGNLHDRALEQLHVNPMTAQLALKESEAQKQLHELQVHQIELKIQNAELQQARADCAMMLARYTDLHDFAPVGYFTLNRDGIILEVNLTGALLLRTDRQALVGQCLAHFLSGAAQSEFTAFLQNVISGQDKQIREMAFPDADKQPLFVHIEATNHASRQFCRLVMLDITERKKTEEALRHSREMLRHLVSHQEHVKEDERKRIAREIHDDLGQNLLALRIDIAMLHERTRHSHPRLNKKAHAALEHIDTTIKAVRTAINNLRPAVLDLGLNAAIEWQVNDFQQRTGIRCELMMDHQDFGLNDDLATALFRILQESFNNVVRHAKADYVRVEVRRDKDHVFMSIVDNGVGFFPDCRRKANSFGLLGIDERVNALQGEMSIDSGEDKGTSVHITLPIKKSART